jgi:cytochrome P450 family 6
MLPHDRRVHADTKSDPFSGNIFVLTGEEWKQFQTRLTPSFTFGKLKSMFPMI